MIIIEEMWKDIPNYEGLYQISNFGNVKSLDREFIDKRGRLWRRKGKMMTLLKNDDGYLIVKLSKNDIRKQFFIHRLVMMVFKPCENMENLEVNHKDFNRKNNHLDNLEWITHKENVRYSIKNGNYDHVSKGENNGRATFTNSQIKTIRAMYRMGWSIPQIVFEIYWIDRKTDVRLYKNLHGKISDIVHYRTFKDVI